MEQIRFNYSMKNIPIPPRNSYLKSLIEKVESVIKRMRWKAHFHGKKNSDERNQHTHNADSDTEPTINTDLNPENATLNMKIWIDSKQTSWTW